MSDHRATPRLAPLTPDEMTDEQRQLAAPTGERPLNIFATLVRAPGLYRRWAPFGGKLLRGGKLPERDRELVILRTALRCACAYEWGQHVGIARAAGLRDEEILRVADGAAADGWSAHDRALIAAVDELQDAHRLSDETWETLGEAYTEEQLIELLFLSGHYALLAGALNSLAVQPEGPLPPLGQV